MLRVLPPTFKPVKQPDLFQDGFDVGGKTRNISIKLVLQQCCKTSCTVSCYPFFRTFRTPGEYLFQAHLRGAYLREVMLI